MRQVEPAGGVIALHVPTAITLPLGLVAALAVVYAGLLAVSTRRATDRRTRRAMALVVSGGRGVGTVTGVHDTGLTVRGDPRVQIVMAVEPVEGGTTLERRKTVTVARAAIPRVGDRFPVWYDRLDPSDWAFGTEVEPAAPPEVQELFARARRGA